MKLTKLLTLIGLLSLSTSAVATSPLAGRWEGDLKGKPAVILHLTDREGKISGTAVFNIVKDMNGNVTVVPGVEQEVINAKLEGETFTFSVEILRDDGTQDIVNFSLTVVNGNEAILNWLSREQPSSAIKMVRQKTKADGCERCF